MCVRLCGDILLCFSGAVGNGMCAYINVAVAWGVQMCMFVLDIAGQYVFKRVIACRTRMCTRTHHATTYCPNVRTRRTHAHITCTSKSTRIILSQTRARAQNIHAPTKSPFFFLHIKQSGGFTYMSHMGQSMFLVHIRNWHCTLRKADTDSKWE